MTKRKMIFGVSGGYGDVLLHTPMMKEAMRRNPDADVLFVASHPEMIERSFPVQAVEKFRFRQHLGEDGFFHGDMILEAYNSHFYNPLVMRPGKSHHAIDVIARLYLGDDDMASRDMTLDLPEINDRMQSMIDGINHMADGRPTVGVITMTAIRQVKPYSYVKHVYQKDMPEMVCEGLAFKMPEVFFVQFGLTVERPMLGSMDCRGLTILESIFLMSRLDSYLVPEGAYAHAMAALKRKGCVLWTCMDQHVYAHPRHQVLVEVMDPILSCQPCNRPFGALGDMNDKGFPWTCDKPLCQSLISIDMVKAGVRQALKENGK
jgi:hypothetical protein